MSTFKAKFRETNQKFNVKFGEVIDLNQPEMNRLKENLGKANAELEENEATILRLENEVSKKNGQIQTLSKNNATLAQQVGELTAERDHYKQSAEGFYEFHAGITPLIVTENGTYYSGNGITAFDPVTVEVTTDNDYDTGYSHGYTNGFMDSEENFHNTVINPNRTDWSYFCYGGKDGLASFLKPEDTRNGTNFQAMFQNWTSYTVTNISSVDIPILDTSKGKTFTNMFLYSGLIKRIMQLDLSNATAVNNMFNGCTGLEDIWFVSESIKISLSFSSSHKLTRDCIRNILESFLNKNVTGQTLTLSKKAVDKAFETSEGANDGSTSDEWAWLLPSASNWTISLV